ncbi:MAG: hypothetical protein M1831_000363 [Alyxoria varia]|nr:MAG: hypothetical protein M1831_000363 [Alyxoria varia]
MASRPSKRRKTNRRQLTQLHRHGRTLGDLILNLPPELRRIIYGHCFDNLTRFQMNRKALFTKREDFNAALDKRTGVLLGPEVAAEARSVLCESIKFCFPLWRIGDFVEVCQASGVLTSIRHLHLTMVNKGECTTNRRCKSNDIGRVFTVPNLKTIHVDIDYRDYQMARYMENAAVPQFLQAPGGALPPALGMFKKELEKAVEATSPSIKILKKSSVKLRVWGPGNDRFIPTKIVRGIPLLVFLPKDTEVSMKGVKKSS